MAKRFPTFHEIGYFLCRIHRGLRMFILLRQMNEFQTILPYILEAHFYISCLSTSILGSVTFLDFINLIIYGLVIIYIC